MHTSVWEVPQYATCWAALLPPWAASNFFFLGWSKWVIDLSPQLVTILKRNSKSTSHRFKLIHISRVRQITSLGYRKKIIPVIRETPSVISEESQGTREVPIFFQRKEKMNSENYQVVSLTATAYKILEGIIKQITCQCLEIDVVITRKHAKLTSFVFLIICF